MTRDELKAKLLGGVERFIDKLPQGQEDGFSCLCMTFLVLLGGERCAQAITIEGKAKPSDLAICINNLFQDLSARVLPQEAGVKNDS